MPAVELLAVGTELLLGQLTDTNTATIAAQMALAGVDVYGTHAAGDNTQRIAAALRAALERVDGVICTGGLGPTVDDLTKEAVFEALDVPSEFHEPSWLAMERYARKLGWTMSPNNRKQALLPRGATVLENQNGSAPGFIASRADGKFIACMPGVPAEMRPMLMEGVLPWLRERFDLHETIVTRVVHTIRLGESEIDRRIENLFRASVNPKIAILAHGSRCDVKIMAKATSEATARELIAPLEHEICARLKGHVYGFDDQTLAGAVLDLARASGKRIAVAESCTGGQICAAFTAVPGASDAFAGGVVAYENSVKTDLLGVDSSALAANGAVSEAVAADMAAGVRKVLHADIAVSCTGIAGPGGATPEKPVGLVWLAISGVGDEHTQRMQFRGDRATIAARATTAALGLLWNSLEEREPITSPAA